MGFRFTRQDDGSTVLHVPVDDRTAAWLAEIADLHHAPVELVAGAVLRDVCQDDQDAHLPPSPALRVVGGTDAMN